MLKIRLKRYGRKNRPSYRIVVMKSNVKRDGKAIAELGFYDPLAKTSNLNTSAMEKFLQQGAHLTAPVRNILSKYLSLSRNPLRKMKGESFRRYDKRIREYLEVYNTLQKYSKNFESLGIVKCKGIKKFGYKPCQVE